MKQNKLIRELIQVVEDNMADERVDIEFLSSQLCLSHSSLFRKVKALTGLSINEEGGAAAGIVLRVPMFPEFEPSFIRGLRGEEEQVSQLEK